MVNLGPIGLFSKYKLATSSNKQLESIEHGHIACLTYKLLATARGCDDLSIGFDRSRDRRQRELTKSKKGKYHVRTYLKDIFGYSEHQEKATYGLGYILTLTRKNDCAVLNKDNAINDARIKICGIHWYVPHYTPSIEQQAILFKQVQSKTPTQLQYSERPIFMNEVNTQNLWNFELGTQEELNVPVWVFVIFKQSARDHDQNLNNDTFYRMPVASTQCIIGTERYPDSGILLNYDDDEYSLGYGKIKESFRALTKDDILQPYIGEDDFRSSNDSDNIGYNIHDFDITYQKFFENAQPVKVKFLFYGVTPVGIYGYALASTNRSVSKGSDRQRMFHFT